MNRFYFLFYKTKTVKENLDIMTQDYVKSFIGSSRV